MPVLLSKSGVRSSHFSSSLGRRIQSAHLLCNFHKREKKKKERTHCTAPISKTSLTIHFFSYVPCTLGHKHGGNSWVAGCNFFLFLQFPFYLSFYSSTFSPCPFSYPKNRSLSLLSSLRTFHPSRSWNSQNIPLSPYWTTSLFSTPSLLKILLHLTYFSHRLIHSFFYYVSHIFNLYSVTHPSLYMANVTFHSLCKPTPLTARSWNFFIISNNSNRKGICYDPGNCHGAINVCLNSIELDIV